VRELPGRGIEAEIDGATWRLGSPAWLGGAGDLVLARDGEVVVSLEVHEAARPDAREELRALAAEGYETWILSGDRSERVLRLAAELGVPAERAIGGCSPAAKAEWIAAHDREDTLFVGDGINDGPAAEIAFLSGTPAVDRPFVPARTDFFFTSAGLAPIRALLATSRRLRRVARRNLALAAAYNVFAVSLCAAGLMQPWLAAVLMPASSLVVSAATASSMRDSAGSVRT
jgi:Cu2+-exporting ATPase